MENTLDDPTALGLSLHTNTALLSGEGKGAPPDTLGASVMMSGSSTSQGGVELHIILWSS